MRTKRKPSILAIATAVVIFNFTSCKYEDGPAISLRTKKGRLTGEWEVQYVDGEKANSDGQSIIFDFDKSGDFKFSYTYSGGYNYSYKGDWEWEDKKTKLEITIDGTKTEWEITRLTNKELEFEDEDNDKWELEKQ